MSPTVNPETPVPGARHRLERAGIGVVEVTELCPPATEWEELEHLLTVAIAQLLWNDFLVIEYDHTPATSDTPAAWVRTGPGGAECAVSSARQLPPEAWPHHTEFFEASGWRRPLGVDQPWTSGPHPPEEAARRVLTALRHGRSCNNPYAFHWGTGSFPVPEGHTGTLTVINPEQCPTDTDI
ncbi:hypothetical protein [Kocuria sp.]|uniref:TY-Chap domain-containing protein n=1 Tax=Kocuria sp. TaxID=1871328 RepID=UPI0026E040C8|nr:hypothetical protein [Kocuria sp.]MDO5366955.1 hypothetical protein [Kocuria sp.]